MITYRDTVDGIDAGRLGGFFVGWPNPPTPETHLEVLRRSDAVVLAVESESGQVVGFITAITDHVLAAYIPHLEVLPDFQGKGIGTTLVERVLDKLGGIYMIDLLCDPDVVPFYERIGVRQAGGMCIRNYDRQSGTLRFSRDDGPGA